tara:strand:- start:13156 stop:14499 length:1344 start_codon:yes stop_codon:yes gene_type:complete
MKSTLTFFFSLLLLISCQDPVDDKGAATWTVLQKNILKPNCSNCHMAGSAIERQSGLDLSLNDSYDSLVGVAPKNSAANKDGLLIVSPEGGMKGLTKSYLWEKINAYDQEHFLSDHPEYGQLMPPGGNFLSDGELQFIRAWIEAGAPKSGNVIDENLLLDTNRYEPKPFSKPAPPLNGLQLHLGPFEIQPNFEREFFQYTELNHTGDLYVNRIEIEMRPGSHHFLLYTFNENIPQQIIPNYGEIRDLRDRYGATNLSTLYTMQFHKFFGGTQWSRLDYVLPDGVALKIPAKYGLDQNTHYVNRTDSTMIGEVYTNIHLIEQNNVKHVAQLFDFNNSDIYLPPKKITTIQKVFRMDDTYYFGQVFSHAHEKMTEFLVEIDGGDRDGEVIYWTNDWEHPPIINYNPPIIINAGEGLRLKATYDNPTNEPVGFGFKSTDEMMILFGWYYK